MHKISLLFAVIFMAALHSFAQKTAPLNGFEKSALPIVYLPDDLSVHFISPEPIQYVDISTKSVTGDLPIKNILRIRRRADSVAIPKDAVITIVGEKFIAQYRIVFAEPAGPVHSDIEIMPAETRAIDYTGVGLSQPELKAYALDLVAGKPEKNLEHSKAYDIRCQLNHIYTLGDYIFLDLSYKNKSKLKYDIDELRFKIEDKKVTKATTVQTIEIKPEFVLFESAVFKKHYRNIFVFKKFTFPGNKLLNIELSEKQFSGRIISLKIPYKDILDADLIPSR
ncbi:conjugative transposon protein TraN [Mucilaginibacter sp. UYCu711]|uniref:conjugative transposon protein TraN n=1 Tax=Mucilaginibacter sp. UYCu711 TaxID=3156339 RepID=UPI003D1E84ED